ncbi:hypothetical protein DYI25_05660 [Mesobacillus boroniphilus]|uniref:Uncharacterized protein n=1 Tax=Mesobacillus boroniphilus TaxID=308892 RepID=A0A944GWQ9_9BACI|nr:hypothetical protein [Mesobacillus boroniphilus]MBS8263920.1 hypothetical protein [Mesobacillus boroniphilus]
MIKIRNFLIVISHYFLWGIVDFIPFSWGWAYSTASNIYYFALLISAVIFTYIFIKKKRFISFAFLLVYSLAMALSLLASIRGL